MWLGIKMPILDWFFESVLDGVSPPESAMFIIVSMRQSHCQR